MSFTIYVINRSSIAALLNLITVNNSGKNKNLTIRNSDRNVEMIAEFLQIRPVGYFSQRSPFSSDSFGDWIMQLNHIAN